MFQKFIVAATLVLMTAGCIKAKNTGCHYNDCAVVAPASEISGVQSYLASKGITDATQHCSGAFFKIVSQGSGTQATACSDVNVTYAGYLTNGSRFDSSTLSLNLQDVIRGWTNLMPQLKSGGEIRMYIPPTLGYGANGTGPIPANSILIFNVKLNSVN